MGKRKRKNRSKGRTSKKRPAPKRLPKWALWGGGAALVIAAIGVFSVLGGWGGTSGRAATVPAQSATANTTLPAPSASQSAPPPAGNENAAPAAASQSGTATQSSPADVPDFNMVTYQGAQALGGKELDFLSLFGRKQAKPVVLNFWAGGCPPCRAELPGFEHVYKEMGSRVLFIGVDIGPYTGLGTHAEARRLLHALDITYPAAYATTDPTRLYGISGIPTTILFEANGTPFYGRVGFFPEQELQSKIAELLAASK